MRLMWAVFGVAISWVGLAPAAHAQAREAEADMQDEGVSSALDAEARALFQAGRHAFSDGRYEDALTHFTRSHELSQRPELLFNIGTTEDRLRHEPEAVAAFEGYLEALPEAANRREVEGRLRVLREEIAREAEEDAARERAAADAASRVTFVPADETTDDGENVLTAWWLWTIVGVVVAGAVVGAVVGTQVSGGDSYPDFMRGSDGMVVFTLTVPTS